ncbi:MAG TPA: hypothetical protein VN653_04600 [Anaerolineales bacterium]|nr:hypothetical protein [Anaerolineales bacterium]
MDTQPENGTVQTQHELPSRNKRFQLFLIAYMVGVIIVSGIMVLRLVLSKSDIGMGLLETVFRVFLLTTFSLPLGLLLAIGWVLQKGLGLDVIFIAGFEGLPSADNTFQAISQVLSYVLLLGISITGILTGHQRTFRILYYIFIGILILDIGGCMSVLD